MNCEVKDIGIVDEEDFLNFMPENGDNFCEELEVAIGPKGESLSSLYTLYVFNRNWMNENHIDDFLFLKGHMLVPYFSPKLIKQRVEDIVRQTSGKDWNEISMKLTRYFNSEFER